MAPSSSSSSSSRNWSYDVFPSFSGEDVRKTFLSHFLKELDRKLIIAFKDSEIERSRSLVPELKQAIKDSMIAVVIFSKNYASSKWCLNELLEIVKCKEECGQLVIPVFYGLDPSHVRKQTGDFGKIFDKTCQNKAEDQILQWRRALTDVANIVGYHMVTWANEASMIDEIANDVLSKLNLNLSDKFEDYVGIEDHIRAMSSLLHLESEEVRMVGIWGATGIGKTTIARCLYSRLSRQFQSSIFIDKFFISKSMEVHGRTNLVDYNMKLHLQRTFLAEILGKKDIKIDHLGAMENMLKHRKTLIIIDDVGDQDVLNALAGRTQWFGSGSRIIVVTKDRHFLRAHGIDHIYEVSLQYSEDLALEMFCRSAFKKSSPPDGFTKLAWEVVKHAGSLPVGLEVLGSNLRGLKKEDWMDMLPRIRNGLDGKIERTLRVSYDSLNNKKDQAIFRHVACLFNHQILDDIKLLLADSDLDVNIGLRNLIDKALIHETSNRVYMHPLLQEMGKEIVRTQSDEPGEREFLTDAQEICDVLENNTGTTKVLGISLNVNKIGGKLHVHKNAFKGMRNLIFLEISAKGERRWRLWPITPCKLQLPKSFDYLPPKLKYLCWYGYPMRCMPSKFLPENLVMLKMVESSLEKLWEGVVSLTCLKEIDLCDSKNLKEIPDLSKATNLERLNLSYCSSLLKLPSSIRNLKKLRNLNMDLCKSLETIPSGIYLKSLDCLNLSGCSQLRSLPEILTNISEQYLAQTAIEESSSNLRLKVLDMTNLKTEKLCQGVQQPFTPLMTILNLSHIPNLVELPCSFQDLNKLKALVISDCKNLETLPNGINLQSLEELDLGGCSKMRSFPNISTNISKLNLWKTAIEEVPWWIKNFSSLSALNMNRCSNLLRVSLNILKLKHLRRGDFLNCGALTEASWDDFQNGVAMTRDSNHSIHAEEASSPLPENYISMVDLRFIDCFNFDPKVLLEQETRVFMKVTLSGEEVPSYFTHRTNETTLNNIPLPHISPSQPFLRFKACALCDVQSIYGCFTFKIQVCFRFMDISGNHFDYADFSREFYTLKLGGHLVIFDCYIPLNKDVRSLADQLNYDHVDIQFRLIDKDSSLKGCGIKLVENTSNTAYLGGHETERSQECGDSAVESNPHVCKADEDNVVNEDTEHNFRWTRRNSALILIFGIALLILFYEGIVKDFIREILLSWG